MFARSVWSTTKTQERHVKGTQSSRCATTLSSDGIFAPSFTWGSLKPDVSYEPSMREIAIKPVCSRCMHEFITMLLWFRIVANNYGGRPLSSKSRHWNDDIITETIMMLWQLLHSQTMKTADFLRIQARDLGHLGPLFYKPPCHIREPEILMSW